MTQHGPGSGKGDVAAVETAVRAWFDNDGWKLEPAVLRAYLEEHGADEETIVELIDEGADRRRQHPQPRQERSQGRVQRTGTANGNGRLGQPSEQVPQNLEAEESVLGAAMLSPGAIAACREILERRPRVLPRIHARIWRAALALADRGEPVDAITLTDELEERGHLDDVGGRVRIHELAALVPATANAGHYARIVVEAAQLRDLIRLGGEIAAARLGTPRRPPPTTTPPSGATTEQIGWASRRRPDARRPPGRRQNHARAAARPRPRRPPLRRPRHARHHRRKAASSTSPPTGHDRPTVLARMVDEHTTAPTSTTASKSGPARSRSSSPTSRPASPALPNATTSERVFIDSIKDVIRKHLRRRTRQPVQHGHPALPRRRHRSLALHHQRKEQQGAGKPKQLADVYGNTFLTAGMGSVILLWGDPGDPIVELRHLKQPVEEIGPWDVRHDHDRGITLREQAPTSTSSSPAPADHGLTAQTAAGMLRQTDTPSKSEIEKARRQLLWKRTPGDHVCFHANMLWNRTK
jgi:replicative DNA helicase